MNHTIEECYSKHEYPSWYKQRNEYNNNSQETESQHKREQQVCNLSMKEDPNDKQNVKDETINGLTAEQMQKLLKLLNDSDDYGHSINQIQKHANPTDKIPQGTFGLLIHVQLTMLHKIKNTSPLFFPK